jgi:hypothetical protein
LAFISAERSARPSKAASNWPAGLAGRPHRGGGVVEGRLDRGPQLLVDGVAGQRALDNLVPVAEDVGGLLGGGLDQDVLGEAWVLGLQLGDPARLPGDDLEGLGVGDGEVIDHHALGLQGVQRSLQLRGAVGDELEGLGVALRSPGGELDGLLPRLAK